MRRLLVLLSALLLGVAAAVPAVAAAEAAQLEVYSVQVEGAYRDGEQVMLPVRAVLEILGYRVTYIAGSEQITLDGNMRVTLQVGSDRADVGGTEVQLRAPVVEREGRAFVSDDLLGQMGLNVERRPGAVVVAPRAFWPAQNQEDFYTGIGRIIRLLAIAQFLCAGSGC